MRLLHVTSHSLLDQIMAEGLKPGSYLLCAEEDTLREYYEEEIRLDGDTPITLEISLSSLVEQGLKPDLPSIREPITRAIGKSEDEVIKEWEDSSKDWRASLEIVGSLRCEHRIPPDVISFPDMSAKPAFR